MDDDGSQAALTMEADEEKLPSQSESSDIPEKPTYDDEFVWEDYLEETQAEAVPPAAFHHVEKSLESGMEENQLVEVVHQGEENFPTGYWVAKIVTICGPLLRLRYIAQSSINVEIWKEVSCGDLHPIGWSVMHSISLSSPQELSDELKDMATVAEAKKAVEEAVALFNSVPEEALEGDGYTAVDRIKQGMKVEVLYEGDPFSGWVATVLDNIGGRLQLRYDTPDCSGKILWLFYQHNRLRPLDWIYHQGSPWQYKNPASASPYEEAEWAALLEMSRDDARHSQLPVSLLLPIQEPKSHSFRVGMLIEVVHPCQPNTVELGIISHIINSHYFQVTIKTNDCELSWVTNLNDPLILPVGFCNEHELSLSPPSDWDKDSEFSVVEFVKDVGAEPSRKDMFEMREPSEDLGFEMGNKLECVHPTDMDRICIATVKKLCGHLLVIELDSEVDPMPVIRTCTSQDLFPMGWCQSNGYPIQLPATYSPKVRSAENDSLEESRDRNSESPGATDVPATSSTNQLSMWCPRLYINHCCFTGPYLSKSKVAKQSQSIGPGSVELVLREVLAMTINAAYIPTRALRELERSFNESRNVCPSWNPMVFKAKFKRYTCTANIPIAITANGVSDFLSLICRVLQCCPNLWSTKSTGENCPYLCTSQMLIQANPSSYFRGRGRIASHRGGRGGLIYRRKRGGRKRLFVPIRANANRLLQPKSLSAQTFDTNEEIEDDEECEVEEVDIEEENTSGPEEVLPAYREEPLKRKRTEYPDSSPGLEPAAVTSDPLQWTVKDVEIYVASQPAISHHAVRLREQEVDGRAFLLLNLPTLVQHLGLPHSSAVSLAQHICRVKLAHFMYYRCDA